MLIVRALYGLKSSGVFSRAILSETLGKDSLGYTSTSTYKDIWIKREVLPDRNEYYYMVLLYFYDILCNQKEKSGVIDALGRIYVMETGIMGTPDCYLGANTKKVKTQNGNVLWETHSRDYCKAEIENLEKTLAADGKSLLQYGDVRNPYPSRQ